MSVCPICTNKSCNWNVQFVRITWEFLHQQKLSAVVHANRLATSFSAQVSCRSDARLAGQNLWSSSELLNTKPSALRGNGVLCIVSPLHWPRALPQCNPLMLHISFDLATLNGHSQLLTIWLFHVEQLGLTWTTWNGSQAKQLPATIPGRCIHDWLSELTNLIKPKHLTRQKHGGNIQCYTMLRFQFILLIYGHVTFMSRDSSSLGLSSIDSKMPGVWRPTQCNL